jgi:hypothetical protein
MRRKQKSRNKILGRKRRREKTEKEQINRLQQRKERTK